MGGGWEGGGGGGNLDMHVETASFLTMDHFHNIMPVACTPCTFENLCRCLWYVLNNLLECIAYNIYIESEIISMTLVIILKLDPRHYFVWTCVITVFPVHSLNKRFLVNWLTYERPHVDVCDMSICTFIHKMANVFSALSHAQVHELLNAVIEA